MDPLHPVPTFFLHSLSLLASSLTPQIGLPLGVLHSPTVTMGTALGTLHLSMRASLPPWTCRPCPTCTQRDTVNTQVRAPPLTPASPKLPQPGRHVSQGLHWPFFLPGMPFPQCPPAPPSPPSGLCRDVSFPGRPFLATLFKGTVQCPSLPHPLLIVFPHLTR